MRRVHVVVEGSVQGVFFRASCAERAEELGLAGWVRNGAPGRVEAEFEGPTDAIATMLDWCAHGPPLARVERVQVRDERPAGDRGFVVTG